MGCDIHLYVEKKIDGRWQHANPPKIARTVEDVYDHIKEQGEEAVQKYLKYYPYKGVGEDWNYRERYPEDYRSDVCTWDVGRNYDLFAILADVRNGRGFAGIKTGDGFNPISEPKGLPDDASEAIKAESDRWNGVGHSHTWLTLKELQDYDWDQRTIKQGVIGENYYKELKAKGELKPDSWSGDVSGWSCRVVDPEIMDAIIAGVLQREVADPNDGTLASFVAVKTEPTVCSYHVRLRWEIAYREHVSFFLNQMVPELEKLAEGDPESVRMVFWFDN